MNLRISNTRNLLLLILATAVIPLTYSSPAMADSEDRMEEGEENERRGKRRRGRRGDHSMKHLNLTEEQREKIKTIRQSHREKIKAARERMKNARTAFKEAMKNGASNSALNSKHEEKLSSRSDFARARFAKVLAVRAVLTPEQRKKFKGMRGERKERRKGKRGKRGRRARGNDGDQD